MVFILNMYTGGVFTIYFKIGIENKIISTRGYCCVITDEGTGFFDDLKKKESKHESDLSLLKSAMTGKEIKQFWHKTGKNCSPKQHINKCITTAGGHYYGLE